MSDGRARDFVGYGRTPPHARWPGEAQLALVVVLNFEEGAEHSIPAGDPTTETGLTDAIPGEVPAGTRDLVAESLFEYGSRAGFWRLHRFFAEHGLPLTINACSQALRHPEIAAAINEAGYDLCCHGERFERQFLMNEATERAMIARAVAGFREHLGRPPLGWQSRYSPSIATRRLLVEQGGFTYDADSYADDLPYWTTVHAKSHLVVPHTFTLNDNRLVTGRLGTGNDFFDFLTAAFAVLYQEGESRPKLMTVSLHGRVSGHPARFDAIRRFVLHALSHEHVWFAGRSEVARHWATMHPAS